MFHFAEFSQYTRERARERGREERNWTEIANDAFHSIATEWNFLIIFLSKSNNNNHLKISIHKIIHHSELVDYQRVSKCFCHWNKEERAKCRLLKLIIAFEAFYENAFEYIRTFAPHSSLIRQVLSNQLWFYKLLRITNSFLVDCIKCLAQWKSINLSIIVSLPISIQTLWIFH